MYINDLIMTVKKGSIDDLLPLSLIKNDNDVMKYFNLGYLVHKLDDFVKSYPELQNYTNYLYYDKSFGTQLIYYNPDELILSELNVYSTDNGFQSLIDTNKLLDLLNHYKNISFEKKFYFITERFRLDFVLKNINRLDNQYKYFIDAYSLSDYGFDKIKKEDIKNIFSHKTIKDKDLTKDKLKNLPEEIKVYRGIGSKSLEDGYSYTLNYDVARFFAFRLSKRDDYVKILEAKVKKLDIIEYLTDRNEEELLILPDKIYDKKVYKYHSFDKYGVDFEIFSEYRELLFDYISYYNLNMSNEHDINHLLRVLVLSQLLADKYNISDKYKDLLFVAAVFHDIGRQGDGEDITHGLNSYNLLCDYDTIYVDDNLKYLMQNHCIDDNKIKRVNNKELNLCLDILKDADALDRQRFGIRDLDFSYLRIKFSKKLSFYAFKLLNVKMYE